MAFEDDLALLVSRELAAARAANDDDRSAGVVSELASQLGCAIAMITHGNPSAIEALLAGSERVVAEVAAEKAPAARLIGSLFGRVRS